MKMKKSGKSLVGGDAYNKAELHDTGFDVTQYPRDSGSHQYMEQFQRLQRCFTPLEQMNNGQGPFLEFEDHRDKLYFFFCACYHLKDWLKGSADFPLGSDEINKYINAHEELRLCADICNAHKHLTLTRARSKMDPQTGHRELSFRIVGTPVVTVRFTIDTNNGPRDAFKLAHDCLELWKAFIPEESRGAAVP